MIMTSNPIADAIYRERFDHYRALGEDHHTAAAWAASEAINSIR